MAPRSELRTPPARASPRRSLRRVLASTLRGRSASRVSKRLAALLVFVASFSVRALHAVDLAPLMHTPQQPGVRMATRYDEATLSMLGGEGVFFPRHHDPSDTGLLARPPGYSMFLGLVYLAFGRGYFPVQFVQSTVDSLLAVLIFLLVDHLLSFPVGVVSGFLVALSPHFSYYANLVLPDTLCVVPIVGAVWLLTKARWPERVPYLAYALAGGLIGSSAWLRPNTLPLAPVIGIFVVLVSKARRPAAARALFLVVASALAISPITIRNYLVYGQFVPVSINMGIVLWEGIADAGGERFGAKGRDFEVAWQEAQEHKDVRYAEWWASPDGIARDRERTRRSLKIIVEHPVWFAGTMAKRMGEMLRGPEPPLVNPRDPGMGTGPGSPLGRSLAWARPVVHAAQELMEVTLRPFLFMGAAFLFLLSWRRALMLSVVPVCYLLFQSMMHLEFRVTLPMQAFLFVFAATTWVLVVKGASAALRGLLTKAHDRP